MEDEEDPKGDKKEDNGPGFLNKKMEQIFLKKDLFIYGVRWTTSRLRIL